METGTSSRSGHTGVVTVYTKGSAGAFATLHPPIATSTSHISHGRTGIGDCIDDAGSCCHSTALYCLANVANGKEEKTISGANKPNVKMNNSEWGNDKLHAYVIHH